jgi:hypothetical protein
VELYDPKTGGFMPSSPGIGMHVEARDPDDKTILSRVSARHCTPSCCNPHLIHYKRMYNYLKLICRFTVPKEGYLLHPIPRVNILFAFIPTAVTGLVVHSW